MVKNSSTNSSFFKTEGRLAASHETTAQSQEEGKSLKTLTHGAKMQGKKGQPNFIPGQPAVGESSAAERKAKNSDR